VPPQLRGIIFEVLNKMEGGMRALLTTVDSVPNPDDVLFRVADYTAQINAAMDSLTADAAQVPSAPMLGT